LSHGQLLWKQRLQIESPPLDYTLFAFAFCCGEATALRSLSKVNSRQNTTIERVKIPLRREDLYANNLGIRRHTSSSVRPPPNGLESRCGQFA
jgi:hypothetical protein